jgi:hypothetical protein
MQATITVNGVDTQAVRAMAARLSLIQSDNLILMVDRQWLGVRCEGPTLWSVNIPKMDAGDAYYVLEAAISPDEELST